MHHQGGLHHRLSLRPRHCGRIVYDQINHIFTKQPWEFPGLFFVLYADRHPKFFKQFTGEVLSQQAELFSFYYPYCIM